MSYSEQVYRITFYESNDSGTDCFEHIEKSFSSIDEGIAWILDHHSNKSNSEVNYNEPDIADILLDVKYFDKDGNELDENVDYDEYEHNYVNYMAEIELIPEDKNDKECSNCGYKPKTTVSTE